MTRGTLEVSLVKAQGLDNDFFMNIDPYVIMRCRSQQHQSTVASGGGSDPEWNETFLFTVTHVTDELNLKIMDQDMITFDDFVGETTISLDHVFAEGHIEPKPYMVFKDNEHCGDIIVGLSFFPESAAY